jgi:hypothetical protein
VHFHSRRVCGGRVDPSLEKRSRSAISPCGFMLWATPILHHGCLPVRARPDLSRPRSTKEA